MSCIDPISKSQYPSLQPYSGPPPVLPDSWACAALLHPFSPLQSNSTPADRESPFFELCEAIIYYKKNTVLQARLQGASGRTWLYSLSPSGTTVSMNGAPPQAIDIGWTLPTNNWFGDKLGEASCAGTSRLNWMDGPEVNWWKIPVGTSTPKPATWMWFEEATGIPVRLMFGQGPPSPTMGDPSQLALFQMFSFTYITNFGALSDDIDLGKVPSLAAPSFSFGNPDGYELFTWNSNFGMTAFMTPVNEAFNPLPTRILYVWKPDGLYRVTSDRSQDTLMEYSYNPGNPFTAQAALLTGPAPSGVTPPPNSGTGFLINYVGDKVTHCEGHGKFPFPQEPPNWVQIPAVQGRIHATMFDIPMWCPNEKVTVVAVLFPPSGTNYPDSTYLWTWYSPLNPSGSSSRPITFMQSQSGVGVGTSLALADYFAYEEFAAPIDPCNFEVPAACSESRVKKQGNISSY